MGQNNLVCFSAVHGIWRLSTSLKLLIPFFMSPWWFWNFNLTSYRGTFLFLFFCLLSGSLPNSVSPHYSRFLAWMLNLVTQMGVLKLTNYPLSKFRFYSSHPAASQSSLVHPFLAPDCNNNLRVLRYLYKSCNPHQKVCKIDI